MASDPNAPRFRSRDWFDDPAHIDMTALYLERFMNSGVTLEELRSGKPIIGIAQSGSDLNPCNRVHLELAERVRAGIRDAGGVPMEFPVHPMFENCRRPTAALDRNLAYLGLVEILHGYPIDAVVLTTGCDKTTPSAIMAASTVDIPAIVLSGGPMLDGWHDGELVGSGTVIWRSRRKLAAGEIDEQEFLARAAASAPSLGHCNTMGTASTMNALAETLGLSLPGCAAIPAPYRERGQMAYATGRRIVAMAYEDLRPSKILTRQAFLNAIAATAAIGGSTNAQPHLVAMARHAGVELGAAGLDEVRASTCRCSSTCSRPASIWASVFTAPAECRRSCASCCAPGASPAMCSRSRDDARREHRRPRIKRSGSHYGFRIAAPGARRFPGVAWEPVRFRDHEDQRDLG